MRRPGWITLLLLGPVGLLALLSADLRADGDKSGPKYLGVDKCKDCHKAKTKGDQYGQWTESKHARAFESLASDEARKIAKEKGVADPQKAPECLKCHVTAFGIAKERLGDKFKLEQGVQCEACHGPGGDYFKMEVMKDREKAKANGLVLPTEAVCVTCHNKNSPTFKSFDFKAEFDQVKHPLPAKK
ncbi:MAG: cytochrome C554 [Planctomycetes bacterium]|nr:cytochrome C554 [Planctomycetota bacterium]